MATPRCAILDYRMGNLRSLANALRACGADVEILSDADAVAGHDRVILPGVGAFGASMQNLRASGMDAAARAFAQGGRPFLGICLGFQVLFERGTEHGDHAGLGWFRGTVSRFDTPLPVPHVGWNGISFSPHALFDGLPDGAHMYFVHSYRPEGVEPSAVIARADYDGPFVCAVARDNVAGMQFHPERSGVDGLRILSNFLEWRP